MFKRRRRRQNHTGGSSANSGQMMNLALFIMLLAFFIVLNSISSYEEVKTARVTRSVEMAFSKDPRRDDIAPSVTPDKTQSVNEGDTFERIEALFQGQIASFETTISRSRGIMMVTLPYDEFSAAVMAVGQKDLTKYPSRTDMRGNFFLPTLVSLIRANIDGAPTRMEILFHTKGNPAEIQNQSPAKLGKLIARVGVFSRRLEKRGVPQKLLNIGISQGKPELVDLVFRKHISFSPIEVKNE